LIHDEAGKPLRMFGMAQDITERKRAAKELVEANRQLRFLSRRQGQVQEDERRRLARELHDQLGQALMASKVNVESALQSAPGDSTRQALVDTIALVDQMLQQVRDISFDLRPPVLDDLGLAPALRWTLDRYAQRAGLITEFFADPTLPRTDVEIETACFRIALEAITNVVRHAQAKKIRLELRQSHGALHLLVRDDGIGFNAAAAEKTAARLGLAGMYERAFVVGGKFECKSTPGEGTEVCASFPISSSEASEE
jgi:signal transduction histidine kinase